MLVISYFLSNLCNPMVSLDTPSFISQIRFHRFDQLLIFRIR